MPFDGSDSTPALNRARLIEALRAGPEDWDFSKFERCACGVAKHIGLISDHYEYRDLGEILALTPRQTINIFLGGDSIFTTEFYGVRRRAEVTPSMVAHALERLS